MLLHYSSPTVPFFGTDEGSLPRGRAAISFYQLQQRGVAGHGGLRGGAPWWGWVGGMREGLPEKVIFQPNMIDVKKWVMGRNKGDFLYRRKWERCPELEVSQGK